MAKHKFWARAGTRELSQRTIIRSDLVRIIESAIDAGLSGDSDGTGAAVLQPERLREIARTTHKIGSGTWKAPNSCGCPLTKAGIVEVGRAHERPVGSLLPNSNMVLERFYTYFDDAVKKHYATTKPAVTLIVVEDG